MSLRTTYVGVEVGGLAPGDQIEAGARTGRVFAVENVGALPVRVRVAPEVPASVKREGNEPIPSAAWLSVTPDVLELAPGEKRTAQVWVSVPDDHGLAGSTFEALLWIHTEGEGWLQAGLRVRMTLSIDGAARGDGGRSSGRKTKGEN